MPILPFDMANWGQTRLVLLVAASYVESDPRPIRGKLVEPRKVTASGSRRRHRPSLTGSLAHSPARAPPARLELHATSPPPLENLQSSLIVVAASAYLFCTYKQRPLSRSWPRLVPDHTGAVGRVLVPAP